MFDFNLQFGADLSFSTTGDIALVSGFDLTQQRLIRRLLTNPGDYLWQPTYGAGLRQYVGSVGKTAQIAAVIKAQCAQEPGVTGVSSSVEYITGGISVTISYTDTETDKPTVLSFKVN